MKFLKKFRDMLFALLPIMAIVLFVHLFFYKFETVTLIKFFVAAILVCVGEVFLLTGIDSTIMPMGNLMVDSLNKATKLIVFLIFAVIFGTFATIAEPDVTVFSSQLKSVGVSVSRTLFVFGIGAGVGLFIALAIFRIIKHIDVKYVYLFLFALIFLLCTQVKSEYIAIAFDAGGATTGIITAPFLLAISTGISNKFSKDNDSGKEVFGMVGLSSLGPIVVVLLIFIIFGKSGQSLDVTTEKVNIFIDVLKNTALAVFPLIFVFFVYDLMFIKLPIRRRLELAIGLVVTFVGLYLFLFGIDFGISEMGTQIGKFIENQSIPVVIVFSIAIGFIVTFCEPSVIVLSKQVQTVTKGNLSYVVVMISIAISMALAILVSALKIIFNINFFYIILIGYMIALLLMFFVPSIFTSLAFDSGGVASGPMTSAFLLPIMLEFATGSSGNALSGFGLIGIVGMSPIIVIQILGLIYRIDLSIKTQKEKKMALKLSYSTEMYSNMSKLELEHKQKYGDRAWERIKIKNMLLFHKDYIQHKLMSFLFVA